MREYVSAKIHGITVTDASLHYTGSVTISKTILDAVGIDPYERVHLVNLNTGNRWDTYTIPTTDEGVFTLNGGGARLGIPGDKCVIMTYTTSEKFDSARVAFLDNTNTIVDEMIYQ